jgi:polygalacturonase
MPHPLFSFPLRHSNRVVRVFSAALFAGLLAASAETTAPKSPFDVHAFGATGNGHAKDTPAFQKALDACAAAGGGEVLVPAGDYLLGSVVLGSNTTLHLAANATLHESPDIADYPIIQSRFEGEEVQVHRALLYADKAANIAILGPGGIIANSTLGPHRSPRAPVGIELIDCANVTLAGFFYQYDAPAPGQRTDIWCIHPNFCQNLTIKDLHIRSQLTNGDGIDVDSCANVQILRCDIDTGDDAISLKSGRGLEAIQLARPTQNVLIQDCSLGSKFAGIGLGTEMSAGIGNVTIGNCTFTHGVNALFVKSRTGRGGYMQDITLNHVTSSAGTFLGIDLVDKGIVGTQPVTGPDAIPRVGNISIIGANVNCITLVDATKISPDRPLDGLTLGNITGVTQRGIALANIKNINLYGLRLTGYDGNLIRTADNVSGSGLTDPSQPLAASSPITKP